MNDSRGHITLVSGSPRRRTLLHAAGFDVTVLLPEADESLPAGIPIVQSAVVLAERKLASVLRPDGRALAADTLVVLGDLPLGKPRHRDEAAAMLHMLSGAQHEVVTGFVVSREGRERAAAVRTKVWFRRLSEVEVERYLDSGEAYDKAGAYAIQGEAGAFVDRIEGSYTNVVGLPVSEVLAAIEVLS